MERALFGGLAEGTMRAAACSLLLPIALSTAACRPGGPDAARLAGDAAVVPGDLDVAWIHGAADCRRSADPAIQVHRYEADTFVLRQSKCVNYEAPFLYLLLGARRALLVDTGATASAARFPLRRTVDALIEQWRSEQGLDAAPELLVAHTHGHGDHVAADGQFAGRPATTLVRPGAASVARFFGFTSIDSLAELDLGARTLDVLPLPGHLSDHIALYDRRTGLLLTGDSLYPGRLYIEDWAAYRASIARLTTFVSGLPVAYVLGNHIEMTSSAGLDYPIGTTYQPREHRLELALAHLVELDTALRRLGDQQRREVHDDFVIAP
jgi:glyoxylase-like metal-dependent hydrolase (beta-lactamase superfamily II)